MFKKKISVLTAMALLSSSLIGCSSSSDSNGGGEATSAEVLANQNARAAIAQIVDKQALCEVILNNGSFPTNIWNAEGLSFADSVDYTTALAGAGYEYNEEAAKEAWAKAKEEVGFDTVSIEILTFDSEGGKKTAEFIQGELADLDGLNATILNLPFDQKLDKESKGEFDIAYAGWSPDYPDPLTFLETMETGKKYAAQVGYSSTTFDSLMAEAKKMTDKALSYEKYAEAEKLMLEEAYIAPLYQTGIALLQRDYVSGIIKPAFGVDYVFTYADVDKADKTLNLRDASDIPTLDVSLASDTVSSQALNNTMEGLVTIGDNNTILPGVATSWESSEDGLTWTFNLRQDSVWSNGDKVTAHDFVYSWKRTIDPTTASTYAFIMYDIVGAEDANLNGGSLDDVGVRAIDDYTLEVTLNRPITYFAELMTFKTFLPQNQAFVEACGDSYGTDLDKQVYNGAFTLSSWKKEDQWTFTKNQNYWNKDAVNLEAINVKVAKESGAAVNLYESGDIDRVSLSSEYVDKYKDDPNFQTLSKPSTYMLMINGSNNNK